MSGPSRTAWIARRRRAAAAERISRLHDRRCSAGMLRQDLAHARDHLLLRDLPLVDRAADRRTRGNACSGRRPARYGDVRHAFLLADLLDDALRDLGRPLERGALRRVDVHRELAHVLVGHERAADHPVQRKRQRDHGGRDADDRHRMRERPSERRGVPRDPAREDSRWSLVLPSLVRVGDLQEPRAEHRRQREADDHRHQDRERHRPAERVDEAARVPGHERHRQEDHDQRQRGRHHRQRHLARALDRGVERRAVLLLDVPEDVLQHDDRVVDDDADGERQRRAASCC